MPRDGCLEEACKLLHQAVLTQTQEELKEDQAVLQALAWPVSGEA